MSYLFGDSSPSTLEVNFIELLRRAIVFSVQALGADQRLADGRERRKARERAAEQEIERLHALGQAVGHAIDGATVGPPESPTARCANAINRAAADAVAAEIARVKAGLASDLAIIDAEAASQRNQVVKALEALLLRHDPPGAKAALRLEAHGGTHYTARLRVRTGFGLEALLDLEIPPQHPFAHDLRIERVLDGLEVHAPEIGGLFRKEVRMVPHKLGKHHISELAIDEGMTVVKVRAAQDAHGPGFDVTVRAERPRVQLARVVKDGEPPSSVDEVSDADAVRLIELEQKLRTLTADLPRGRKALLEAKFDNRPLAGDEHPARLVERLIAALAPTTQEIARRSLTPTELVLKRLLADDRREEIFVSKAELRAKLDPLTEAQRQLFEPLGLVEGEEPTTAVNAHAAKISPPSQTAAGSGIPEIDDVDVVDEAWEEDHA